jgi:thiol-disulfide isomerase/thioredoxin
MRLIVFALLVAALGAAAMPAMAIEDAAGGHPEASPFDASADAKAVVDATLAQAKAANQNAIVVMGANWCHDSRALAGWFATPRFSEMLGGRYQIVYIDVGTPQIGKGRNLDIAKRFGIKKIKGTPTLLLLSPEGKLLNSRKDAASWRNAASRSEDAIYRYFAEFTGS